MRRKEREITEIAGIESVISKADVCRIALADGGIPYIVTMNFGYAGGNERCLYFHCATSGKKLDMMARNSFVCFEMDTDHNLYEGKMACDFGMEYRSVVGWGDISIIEDNDKKIVGLNCIMKHYAVRPDFVYERRNLDNILVLRLDIKEMTGKKHLEGES